MRYVIAVLCALAVVAAQALYGGAMRPVFALPALFLAGLAGALGLAAVFWRNVPSPSFSCVLSVGALAGWLIWRELESPDAWLAGGYLRLTLGCLVMYLIFACALTNPFYRLAFVSVLFLAAVIEAGAAAWQFARPETGPMIPWLSEQLRLWYEPKWNWRGHGTYLNGNHLAWFLNMAGIMAVAVTCWGRWGLKVKILCLYVALASFAGAMVTLSRGGMLGLGAGLTAFLLLSALALAIGARDRRIVGVLVVAAAVVAAGSVSFFVFKNSFVVQQRFDALVSDTYRPVVFEAVWRQAQLEPLLGTGAGTFLYYGREYREMNSFTDDIYAHNDWAQIAADFGFPAFALLVWVVWAHAATGLWGLREVLRKRMAVYSRPQSHAAALLIGALACLAMFVVHSFFDFNMQIPANALLASACLGMLANPGVAGSAGNAARETSLRRLGNVVAGGAAFWLIVLTCRSAGPEYLWLQTENAYLQGRLQDAWILGRTGVEGGRHSRLDRAMGEIYLVAARRAANPVERRAWAKAAARSLEFCVEAAPLEGRNFLLLAEARGIEGRGGAADEAVVQAIQRAPTQGRGYEVYGEFLEEDGRLDEARQVYRVAERLPGSLHARKSADELARKLLILSR